jgi:hypothetical protein
VLTNLAAPGPEELVLDIIRAALEIPGPKAGPPQNN